MLVSFYPMLKHSRSAVAHTVPEDKFSPCSKSVFIVIFSDIYNHFGLIFTGTGSRIAKSSARSLTSTPLHFRNCEAGLYR